MTSWLVLAMSCESGLTDPDSTRLKTQMTTAVNTVSAETYRTGVMLLGLHEVPGTRLPLTSYASSGGTASQHTTAAVFMYSTSSEGGVTLQLRDADDFAAAGDDKGGLASVLARLQEDAALSISYQADSEALGLAGTEESLDHFLLGSTSSGTCLTTSGNVNSPSVDPVLQGDTLYSIHHAGER
ncbi:hypothetical protein M8J76_016734 [Diaphorina citri]|nr:hypothetical protein M8J76_016734 [Diaphorina citri]